jgi:hypothetical protein
MPARRFAFQLAITHVRPLRRFVRHLTLMSLHVSLRPQGAIALAQTIRVSVSGPGQIASLFLAFLSSAGHGVRSLFFWACCRLSFGCEPEKIQHEPFEPNFHIVLNRKYQK